MSLTVVCVVDRRRNSIARALRNAGNTVIESFTTDQAVAMCVSNKIDVAILDQGFFVEVDGWSVAQSLKMVKPGICIVLVTRATPLRKGLPDGVDAMVSQGDTDRILRTLDRLTANKGQWRPLAAKAKTGR